MHVSFGLVYSHQSSWFLIFILLKHWKIKHLHNNFKCTVFSIPSSVTSSKAEMVGHSWHAPNISVKIQEGTTDFKLTWKNGFSITSSENTENRTTNCHKKSLFCLQFYNFFYGLKIKFSQESESKKNQCKIFNTFHSHLLIQVLRKKIKILYYRF